MKQRSPGPALSRVAMRRIPMSASPISSPPSFATISPRRYVRAVDCATALLARTRIGERLDDFVGDVDAGARPDDLLVLEDDVELLGLGDLSYGAIGALDDPLEFLLAPLRQVFVELPLLALKFPVCVAEFALAL